MADTKTLKVAIIQPLLPSYRRDLFQCLQSQFDCTFFAGSVSQGDGFFEVSVLNHVRAESVSFCGIYYQRKVIAGVLAGKFDVVLIFGNVRYLSFWVILAICWTRNVKCFVHGQGPFRKSQMPSFGARIVYWLVGFFAYRYICYTDYSRNLLLSIGVPAKKLLVLDNTIVASALVSADSKDYGVDGVLYIGRLRSGSEVLALVEACKVVRGMGLALTLHVIGDGVDRQCLEQVREPWIHLYGAIFDDRKIRDISLKCRVGCYPGAAGLSIVHMFSLALPSIVRAGVHTHMGPEASYVVNECNGLLFDTDGPSGLSSVLADIMKDDGTRAKGMGVSARQMYDRLSSPSMGEKLTSMLRN